MTMTRYTVHTNRIDSMLGIDTKTAFLPQQSAIFQHACSTPITILLTTLEQQTATNETDSSVRAAFTAVQRLYRLIYDRPYKGRSSKLFFVQSAFREVTALFNSSLYKEIQFKTIGQIPNTAKLKGDMLLFQELIICLLNNAVESYEKNKYEKQVITRVTRQGRLLIIEIVDAGNGMSWLNRRMAFASGFSTKGKGRGYGLSFANTVVSKHFYGQMQVCSTSGVGTRVIVRLPLAK